MEQKLTINDVKRMLEDNDISYRILSYEYGYKLEYSTEEGNRVEYYFNQEGDFLYPTEENISALGVRMEQ